MTTAGHGPLVVLVHGYPQFWWAWRHQIPALAGAGYRVAAVDLRGFGASDKPPSGYDAPTACDDLAAIIRSLGADQAAVVGHGLGAWLAWSLPTHHPEVTTAVAPLGMPHPAVFHRAMWRHPLQWRANQYLRAMQAPFASERQALSAARRLHAWSGPDHAWITDEVAQRYTEAMSVPFAGQAAAEYFRWFYRCRLTPTGVRYLHRVGRSIRVPVLHLQGGQDPTSLAVMGQESERYAPERMTLRAVEGVGHFLPEEAPDAVSSALVEWLAAVHPAR